MGTREERDRAEQQFHEEGRATYRGFELEEWTGRFGPTICYAVMLEYADRLPEDGCAFGDEAPEHGRSLYEALPLVFSYIDESWGDTDPEKHASVHPVFREILTRAIGHTDMAQDIEFVLAHEYPDLEVDDPIVEKARRVARRVISGDTKATKGGE